MILAIDGYEANVPNRVGIGRYAFELLIHLHRLLGEMRGAGHFVRVYLPSEPLADMPPVCSWWSYRVTGPSTLWTFIGLPMAITLDRPGADVVFSPTHYIPRFIRTPRAMAIMDMSFLSYPGLFRKEDLYKLTQWTAYSAKRAAKIFTISQFSKNAIMKAYNVPSGRIAVTYPGLTMNQSVSKTVQTPKYYILAVGTIQPRKNFARLIEAFASIRKDIQASYPAIELVIVGKKGWLYEDILSAPARFGVEESVRFLEFVPDEALPDLYKNALCFVLPSLYEGFGLPALEAMAYKCPVVVSNVSSLPEIVEEAGIYVEPDKTESIAQGISAALKERNSPLGKKRIELGLAQAKKFTWEAAARETLTHLEEIVASKGSTV